MSCTKKMQRTQLAAAILLAFPFILFPHIASAEPAPLPDGIEFTGSQPGFDNEVNEYTIWSAGDGDSFTVTKDTTLRNFSLSTYADRPGEFTIKNGSTLYLNNFTGHDETGIGLSIANRSQTIVTGDGTLKMHSYETKTDTDDQRGSAIFVSTWVSDEYLTNPATLTVTGVNLDLVGHYGMRVENGASVTVDNTDNSTSHVWVGVEEKDGQLVASSATMDTAIMTDNANTSINIKTRDLKLYSTGSAGSDAYLISNSTMPSSGATKRLALAEKGPASITIDADTMDLQAFGGSQSVSTAIFSNATSYQNANIALSGGNLA